MELPVSNNAPKALVLWANDFQFLSGIVNDQPMVGTRVFIWCRAGEGTIEVNGRSYWVEPGYYLFTPWQAHLTYRPDPANPFYIGTVHIIPAHDLDVEPDEEMAHSPADKATHYQWRRDAAIPRLNGVLYGLLRNRPPVECLADYLAKRFVDRIPDTTEKRFLGRYFIDELIAHQSASGTIKNDIPIILRRLISLLERNHFRSLTMEQLAEFADVSTSTVYRLFKENLGLSPVEFIAQRRIERAQHFLRTTQLKVGEVGAKVGYDDPFYFSKVFKRNTGLTPLQYKKRSLR